MSQTASNVVVGVTNGSASSFAGVALPVGSGIDPGTIYLTIDDGLGGYNGIGSGAADDGSGNLNIPDGDGFGGRFFAAGDGTTTSFTASLGIGFVEPGSINVYVNSVLVGTDDGSGGFTGGGSTPGSDTIPGFGAGHTYHHTLSNFPVTPGSVTCGISPSSTGIFADDGAGNLVGSGITVATIVYATGVMTWTDAASRTSQNLKIAYTYGGGLSGTVHYTPGNATIIFSTPPPVGQDVTIDVAGYGIIGTVGYSSAVYAFQTGNSAPIIGTTGYRLYFNYTYEQAVQPPPSAGPEATTPSVASQLFTQMDFLFPYSWVARDEPGEQPSIKTTILTAGADTLAEIGDQLLRPVPAPNGELLPIVTQQLRIKTMSGAVLDQAVLDFFGTYMARLPGETDASLLARFYAGLFVKKGTRAALVSMLTILTGVPPRITEPWRPSDVGGLSATTGTPYEQEGNWYYNMATGCPPCYYGTDLAAGTDPALVAGESLPALRSVFRYSDPGFAPNASGGKAFNGYIDTTWPLNTGAQGWPAHGFATGLPVTWPPSPTLTGTITAIGGLNYYGTALSPPTPTMAGGGYVSCSDQITSNGKQIFDTVVGDPTSAMWERATSVDFESARIQVCSAIDLFRPMGITAWVRVAPIPLLLAEE